MAMQNKNARQYRKFKLAQAEKTVGRLQRRLDREGSLPEKLELRLRASEMRAANLREGRGIASGNNFGARGSGRRGRWWTLAK